MDIELLACHVAQQQELPRCNHPSLESFNSCDYNPSFNLQCTAYNLNRQSDMSFDRFLQSTSLPSFLQSTSLPSFQTNFQMEQQKDCCLGASDEDLMRGLRVTRSVIADHIDGGPAACDPPLVSQKKASMKDASRAETLRRKKMSQWFSKLEILLPPDDIPKFDRCSLLDATIRYIQSLQKTISEASQEKRERASTVEKAGDKSKVIEACDDSTTTPAAPTTTTKACGVNNIASSHEDRIISISVIDSDHAFINAVTSHTDPVLFSSMFSVLHQHHLDVLNANLTRNADKVVFSFYVKVSTRKDYNLQRLKEQLSSVFTSLSKVNICRP